MHLDLDNIESEKLALDYLATNFMKLAVILLYEYVGPFGEAQVIAYKNITKVYGMINCRITSKLRVNNLINQFFTL
jgi:hypothetical protein